MIIACRDALRVIRTEPGAQPEELAYLRVHSKKQGLTSKSEVATPSAEARFIIFYSPVERMTISQEQKMRFVRDGYLPLHDATDEEVIEEVMIEIKKSVDIEFNEIEKIRGRGYERVKNVEKMEPFAKLRDQLFDYSTKLTGDCLKQPCDDSLIPDQPQIKIKRSCVGDC